jgi:hypothetical protein
MIQGNLFLSYIWTYIDGILEVIATSFVLSYNFLLGPLPCFPMKLNQSIVVRLFFVELFFESLLIILLSIRCFNLCNIPVATCVSIIGCWS